MPVLSASTLPWCAELAVHGGQVEKLTLEAEHLSDASVPPRDQANHGKLSWKPNAVAMWLPADTLPTKACSYRHSLPHRPSLPSRTAVPSPPLAAGGPYWRAPGQGPAHAHWLPAHRAGRHLEAAVDAAGWRRTRILLSRLAGGWWPGTGGWRCCAWRGGLHAALRSRAFQRSSGGYPH